MFKTKKLLLFFAVATLIISGCSGTPEGESDEDAFLDEIPVADAETDAVPGEEGLAEEEFGEENELVDEPAEEIAETPQNTATEPVGQNGEYQVRDGDTLMKIAFEVYADVYQWRRIYNANQDRIADFNNVTPGTVLRVDPPVNPVSIERNGEAYLIQPGDTLGTISSSVYGTAKHWKALWDNNRQMIQDPNRIYAGFYLYYLPLDGQSGQPMANQQQQPPARNVASAPDYEAAEEEPVAPGKNDDSLGEESLGADDELLLDELE
jgi:LysM repeat protein